MVHEYEYDLNLFPNTRHGEGERRMITINITVQKVWRQVTSVIPSSEPDQDSIINYYEHYIDSGTRSSLVVSHRELLDPFSPAVTRILLDLFNLGVAPLLTRAEIVSDMINRVETDPTARTDVKVDILAVTYDGDDDLVRATLESFEEAFLLVAAATEAVKGLEKVRFGKGLKGLVEQCMVCLEEFEEGVEVTCMPCKHVYHGECIVKWLETSHVCPLCRFELPTVDSIE